MHHRHHNHHNHRIKIVPFNQADNDETFQTLYIVLYMYTQTAGLKELGTLVKYWHRKLMC